MMRLFTVFLTLGALIMSPANSQGLTAKATFAGGCFWCMEKDFEHIDGIIDVVSGYTGGRVENPTYKQVSGGRSGHVEAIQITYNPKVITFQKLIELYWVNVDPEVTNRQFCDIGKQYRAEIFYHDKEQQKIAEKSKQILVNMGRTIKVRIVKAETFYLAEEYHQNYYKKSPVRYKYYRYSCGRDKRLNKLWGEDRAFPKS